MLTIAVDHVDVHLCHVDHRLCTQLRSKSPSPQKAAKGASKGVPRLAAPPVASTTGVAGKRRTQGKRPAKMPSAEFVSKHSKVDEAMCVSTVSAGM